MKHHKILVIEDEPDITDLIKITLKDSNCTIAFVDNGPDALTMLKEEIPDLILLDIMIPSPDGWEIYRAIRANPEFDQTRVIVITALFFTPEFLILKRVLKTDLIMKKPFDIEELIASVKHFLAENKRISAAEVGEDSPTMEKSTRLRPQ